jgi:hypothetical protein
MVRVIIVVREPGKAAPDFWREFDMPEVTRVGDFVSIYGSDEPRFSEDLIVRHVLALARGRCRASRRRQPEGRRGEDCPAR